MIEVTAILQFNNYSLGNCRYKTVHRMLRDPDGNVMFLPTWWQPLMVYAAKVRNRYQGEVKEIAWNPVVDGTTRHYKRFYAPGRYTRHEAFFPGSKISVHAVLPDKLTVVNFNELLEIVGKYKGISPYKPGDGFGTFKVVSIRLRIHREEPQK